MIPDTVVVLFSSPNVAEVVIVNLAAVAIVMLAAIGLAAFVRDGWRFARSWRNR